MNSFFFLYKILSDGTLLTGMSPNVRWINDTEDVCSQTIRDYHLCRLTMPANEFEKAFDQTIAEFEKQENLLNEAMEQRRALSFLISNISAHTVYFTHPELDFFNFKMSFKSYIYRSLSHLCIGQQIQLYVNSINNNNVMLSYFCPQKHNNTNPPELRVSSKPIKTHVKQVISDRIVVEYKDFLYTISSRDLFYTQTPQGIDYYNNLSGNCLNLFVIGKYSPGFCRLSDIRVILGKIMLFTEANVPNVGDVLSGTPYLYKEGTGIFVRIDEQSALLPISHIYPCLWQNLPNIYPLGIEQEFEVSDVLQNESGISVVLRPYGKSFESGFTTNQTQLTNGRVYKGRLVDCLKDEESCVLYANVLCQSIKCRLYVNSLPKELQPLLETMTLQGLELDFVVQKSNHYKYNYICLWYIPLGYKQVNLPPTLRMTVLCCDDNRLSLLAYGSFFAIYKFHIWDLWQQKLECIKNSTTVLMQLNGVDDKGLLQVSPEGDDPWQKSSLKANDTVRPVKKGLENDIIYYNCGNGLPGMVLALPTPTSLKIGKEVKVYYFNRENHQLLLTNNTSFLFNIDLASSINNRIKVESTQIQYIGNNIFGFKKSINGNKKWAIIPEDTLSSAFLNFYFKHILLFDNHSLDFSFYQIEETENVYAKWQRNIGIDNYEDVVSGSYFKVVVQGRNELGGLNVCYHQLSGLVPESSIVGYNSIPDELYVKWYGDFTADGEQFIFMSKDDSTKPNLEEISLVSQLPTTVGDTIQIRQKSNGRWYYQDIHVTIDWHKDSDILPGIDNELLAKPLSKLEVKILSMHNGLIVDGTEGLLQRYASCRWDGQGVLVDMFVVGWRDNNNLVLAGNCGAGILPISELGISMNEESEFARLLTLCKEGTLIPVFLTSRDDSGVMIFSLARPMNCQCVHESVEIENDDAPTLLAQQYSSDERFFMCQSWKECPLEPGDKLWAEIIAIEKNIMTVRWQSICTPIRRIDSVPLPLYRPDEFYVVGQMIECEIKIVSRERGLLYFKVCFDREIYNKKLDFNEGQLVDVIVERSDYSELVVSHNGFRGLVTNISKRKLLFSKGQHLIVRCQSIDYKNLNITFLYENQASYIEDNKCIIECIVTEVRSKETLIVEYKEKSLIMETGYYPAQAFIAGDKLKGNLVQMNDSYVLTIDSFRHSMLLKGEFVSGTIIHKQPNYMVLELKDGTRGVILSKLMKHGRKKNEKLEIGDKIEWVRCIKIYESIGIALLSTNHLKKGKFLSGLDVGDEVLFTVARVDSEALHGYIDMLAPDGYKTKVYAYVSRIEAGLKYAFSDELLLSNNFLIGDQHTAHIMDMSMGRLELTLKSTPDEYSIFLKVGNMVKGRVVRFVSTPEGDKPAYYLLEWDEFIGILPLRESSYQAFAPLLYIKGEEIMAEIYDIDIESGLPLLSYRKCNINPLHNSRLKKDDFCIAKPIGVDNGNLIVLLPGGIRSYLRIKNHCGTREQYEQLLANTTIQVHIVDIQGRNFYLELAQPFTKGTNLLRGTKEYATIFQIEYYKTDLLGYDAFSDEGLILWIPAPRTNHNTDEDHLLNIGDRLLVRITSNPGEYIVKATPISEFAASK